jgi:hypothetical protein
VIDAFQLRIGEPWMLSQPQNRPERKRYCCQIPIQNQLCYLFLLGDQSFSPAHSYEATLSRAKRLRRQVLEQLCTAPRCLGSSRLGMIDSPADWHSCAPASVPSESLFVMRRSEPVAWYRVGIARENYRGPCEERRGGRSAQQLQFGPL